MILGLFLDGLESTLQGIILLCWVKLALFFAYQHTQINSHYGPVFIYYSSLLHKEIY